MLAYTTNRVLQPALKTCYCIEFRRRFSDKVTLAYQRLELRKEECTLRDARNAFITCAKEYHPDSGSPKADGAKFSEFSEAYEIVIKSLKSKESPEMVNFSEDEEFSIEDILNETIPIAHRKYLTNDGIGFGTPSQRHKQYQAFRVNRASRIVSDYKIQKVQRETEGSKMLAVKEYAKRSKSSHFVDRVVEDLIQESMARGELNDLKGGKIESTAMPYVDQHEYHLNRVLANNGYVPEWVQAKKDIEKSLTEARDILLKEKVRYHTPPYSDISALRWQKKQAAFVESVRAINTDIQVFNLITPLPKTQMLLLVEDKELARVEQMYEKRRLSEKANQDVVSEDSSDSSRSIFDAVKQFLQI